MADTEKKAILERIERLERDNRRLRRAGLAALVAVAALGILGVAQPIPKTLTAHELVLTDAAGNMRAKISAIDGAVPYLILYDVKGRPMLSLKGGGPQPGLAINDITGKTRVMLGGLSPNLAFYDDASDTTVSLDGDALGPRLLFFDAAGKMKVHLGGQGPSLDLMDRNGYETDIGVSTAPNRKTGDMQETTAASIVMFSKEDEQRKFIWRAP
ncbi:MAG: hypothetical protein KGL59_02140 [Acidobacteriota bacterium]|nr:hypothetical protein [Acidobacteriota bacterium]